MQSSQAAAQTTSLLYSSETIDQTSPLLSTPKTTEENTSMSSTTRPAAPTASQNCSVEDMIRQVTSPAGSTVITAASSTFVRGTDNWSAAKWTSPPVELGSLYVKVSDCEMYIS